MNNIQKELDKHPGKVSSSLPGRRLQASAVLTRNYAATRDRDIGDTRKSLARMISTEISEDPALLLIEAGIGTIALVMDLIVLKPEELHRALTDAFERGREFERYGR